MLYLRRLVKDAQIVIGQSELLSWKNTRLTCAQANIPTQAQSTSLKSEFGRRNFSKKQMKNLLTS